MTIFTVYFCGTGSNSFDFSNAAYHSGELVSSLARRTTGHEFVDWIIVDGPGSENLQEDDKFVRPGNYPKMVGVAMGWGWTENVAHALAMVHGNASWSRERLTELNYKVLKEANIPIPDKEVFELSQFDIFEPPQVVSILPKRRITQQELQMQKIRIFRRNHPITQINVVGWSRGAVTTHMFAHALATDPVFAHIPVHIVAIDPVPGTLNFQERRTTLPNNVRRYVVFYARDERSFGFTPTLPEMPPGAQIDIYPLPGRHATLVGNAGNYIGGNGSDTFFSPGTVVRMLTEHYLTQWGTGLTNCLAFDQLAMLRSYDEMIKQHADYVALRKRVYTINQGKDRDVGVSIDWFSTKFQSVTQLKSDGVFINWHHRVLFGRHCSPLFAFIFGPRRPAAAMLKAWLVQAYQVAPYTVKSMLLYAKTGKGAVAT